MENIENSNILEDQDDFEPYFYNSVDLDDDSEAVFEGLVKEFEDTLRFMSKVVNDTLGDEEYDNDGF